MLWYIISVSNWVSVVHDTRVQGSKNGKLAGFASLRKKEEKFYCQYRRMEHHAGCSCHRIRLFELLALALQNIYYLCKGERLLVGKTEC
ncbi:hypothetical protein PEPS_05370 [Persicobacter psychrovividus]|uniref:Transposase DDE domain-containing protein n=1 Tax=Persicobacter psychrovividus TaxID=387638 RepID=A0ABM7VBH8_9BACT|nr:hypothetical protein PEPS_05370 [Persicobacter psychrovividus]